MSAIRCLRAMPGAPHVWHVRGRARAGGGRTSVCVYTAAPLQPRAWADAWADHSTWLDIKQVLYVGEGVA